MRRSFVLLCLQEGVPIETYFRIKPRFVPFNRAARWQRSRWLGDVRGEKSMADPAAGLPVASMGFRLEEAENGRPFAFHDGRRSARPPIAPATAPKEEARAQAGRRSA
jgi:hypothetical protein